ncbi:hypothetical protein ACFFWD_33665 [Bradyrhizobium erythrophlei]|uniref:hypothetical protein n=1 Tax=Bradyrhizobium erythrophlei TaxID=1437360 RepID=UPI0035E57B61
MTDLAQVRIACVYVLMQFGTVSDRKVRDYMRARGQKPGRTKAFADAIKAFKKELEELEEVTELGSVIREWLEKSATELKRLIATSILLKAELPRDAARRQSRKLPERPEPGRKQKFVVLKNAVEAILARHRKGSRLVATPLSGREILRRLPSEVAGLSDKPHINRDLSKAAALSTVLYRLNGGKGKWWRSDRDVPPGYGSGKAKRRYVPRGTELSQTRMGNRPIMEEAVAFMITAGRRVSRPEIIKALGIPAQDRDGFVLMLRNHLRAKRPRFSRDRDGFFYVKR